MHVRAHRADATCADPTVQPAEDDDWSWPTYCDATYKVLGYGTGGEHTPRRFT